MLLAGILKRSFATVAVVAAQTLHAAHRTDLPSLQNQDPSGDFGPETLPRLRIVVLGDSSVTSPGVEPLDASWPRRIALALSDRHYVELRSVAIGGSKAEDVLVDQVDAALALEPHIALVSVGSNDALRGVAVRDFEQRMDEIIGRLEREAWAVGVFGIGDLGTVARLPTYARGFATVRARSFDRAVARAVARHPGVLKSNNWSPLFDPFATRHHSLFAADRFHASAEGHGIFAAAVLPVVEKLVARVEPRLSARPGNLESST